MAARQKLNASYFNGALLIAAGAGACSGSWVVFVAAFAALLVSCLLGQEIRLRRRGRRL